MRGSSCRVGLTLALMVWASVFASAQSKPSSSLTGTVKDAAGGAVSGATVAVKSEIGGGAPARTRTDERGAFSMPSLAAGAYTVTVSMSGFTTSVVTGVRLVADTPGTVAVTLLRGDRPIADSPAVAVTVAPDQIDRLPYATRNVLDALTLLPGVDTSTINRRSTIAGLPQSVLSITMDGVNIQDPYLKTRDGYAARVTPRQDAFGGVTVASATPGADAAGQGAVRIQFVTRSGTDRYLGTAYEYHRDSHLDSNAWFNLSNGLPKDRVTLNEYGASEGGPFVAGRTNAFFFVNYDELRQSGAPARTRTIFQPPAQAGVFSYQVTTGGATTVRTVDVLALAAARGFLASPDPTVAALLAAIRATTATTGVVKANGGDPLTSLYVAQGQAHRVERQPTVRADVNLGDRVRLSGTFARMNLTSDPDLSGGGDAAFPGFPNHGALVSTRNVAQTTLRTSLGARVMNEVRVGGAWGPTSSGSGATAAEFGNQGGFDLALPLVSSATAISAVSRRDAPTWNIDERLTWQRGRQELTFGGDFTRVDLRLQQQTLAPTISFGLDTLDPANAMFTTGDFPGASSGDLANARSLYATLVGSVNGIRSNVALNAGTGQYDRLGTSVLRARQDEGGLYAQDTWRPGARLTLDAGVRWHLQRPFTPRDSGFATATMADVCGVSGQGLGALGRACSIFTPGSLVDVHPQFAALGRGRPAYDVDRGNFAPNLGMTWRPKVESGPFRVFFGEPGVATFRVAYGVAFNRSGMADFVDLYGANPGALVAENRDAALGNLLPGGATLPLLLRTPGLLGLPPACTGSLVPPACTPSAALTYPLAATNQSVSILDPSLKVPFTRSYSIGFERSLGRDTTLDLRYVRTLNQREWITENWNEQNPFESGFLDEFKVAQANLSANIANGRGNTFQYSGPGTGTAPLPIYLAFLTGQPFSAASDSTNYTGQDWTNTTLIGRLSVYAPNPVGALNDLWGDAGRRANMLGSGGPPANAFVMNPDLGANSANVTRSAGSTQYDSLQVALRRRLSRGLSLSGNYTFATRWATTLDSIRFAPVLMRSTDVVRHAVKLDWTWEIPFGRDRRFGSGASRWLDGVFGGWAWSGTGRVQSGRLLALGGVRLVGMTEQELQRDFHIRIAADRTVTTLSDDIILNTRRAFSTDPTSPTGYSALGAPTGRYIAPASTPTCIEVHPGDCGEAKRLYVTGPVFTRFDMSVAKTFPAGARRAVQVEFDLLNVFNAINFNPVLQAGGSATLNQVTSAYRDAGNTFDPGGRLGQIVLRIKW